MVTPINGRLLIEPKGQYKHFTATEEKFGTSKTQGILKAIAKDIAEEAKKQGLKVGQRVYFGKYEDSAPFKMEGEDHILLKLEDVGGWED